MHKFSAKAVAEIEDKQTGKAKQKKAFRDPEQEYIDSLYVIPDSSKTTKYGVPANGMKNCAITACKYVDGLTQTFARGAFHVIPGPLGLLEIKGKPVRDDGLVRIGPFGKKVTIPRYRGRFDEWECTFQVDYNENVISPEQIVNLYETAGFSVGLCEWRPEKGGLMGRFEVKR